MFWYILAGLISIAIIIPIIKDSIDGFNEVEDYVFWFAFVCGVLLLAVAFSGLCSVNTEPKSYEVVEDSAVVYTIEQYDNSTEKIILQEKDSDKYKFYGKTSNNNLPVFFIKAPQDASIIQYVDQDASPKVTRYRIKRPWHQKVFGAIGINKYIYIFEIPENTIRSVIN